MAKNQNSNNYGNRNLDVNKALESGGRIPPQAVEVEEAILGGMLIDNDAATIAIQLLKESDFYRPSHRHIFKALIKLYERENPLDLLTVEQELKDQELLDDVGGSGYLAELTRAVSSSASIEYHCQIVAEKAIKRDLILHCTEIIAESYDSVSDPYELLDRAEQKVFELANNRSNLSSQSLGDILKKTLSHLESIRGKSQGITGIPTGLDVDKATAGWQRSDLIIIAARPAMGKTAFVLTTARNSALYADPEKRAAVALFSLEMSGQQLVQRLLTMEARVNAQDARTGRLQDEDFQELIQAAGRLFDAKIFIDDTPGLNLMELRSKCRRLKSEHDIDLIIIDYLQLMSAGNTNSSTNREQEIAMISRGLKILAKELDVPVIALSQLSRAVEQRTGDKRPQLSDLRESGSIEQDADVVCFLYRPEYYGIQTDDEGNSTAGVAELIIGKQRNGPTDTVRLQFVQEYARFENLSNIYKSTFEDDDAITGNTNRDSDGLPPHSGGTGYFPSNDESPF